MNNLAFQIYGSTKSGIFQSTWKTDNAGVSSSTQIELPLLSGGTYNFWIDWGDGSTTNVTSYSQRTHTYASAGTYTLRATGTVGIWQFANGGDKLKILTVSSWGKLILGSNTFNGCSNLTLSGVTDIPDLSTVTSFQATFFSCSKITTIGRINEWNTSTITSTIQMFHGCTLFNSNISNWNVSNITAFNQMFFTAGAFNNGYAYGIVNTLPWITTNAITFNQAFTGAVAFNSNISAFNVSKVTNFTQMFQNANSFNNGYASGVSNQLPWTINTTSSVDMSNLFAFALAFNSNLGTSTTPWDVSKVTSFANMFNGASKFNNGDDSAPINNWSINTVSNVSMNSMFMGASIFNRDISNWNMTKVNHIGFMFNTATAFNQPVGNWERTGSTLGNVTNMRQTFRFTNFFNQDISNWNVNKVTDFGSMFNAAIAFNNGSNSNTNPVTSRIGIDGWDINTVSNVNMESMFASASIFNRIVENWNMTKVINTGGMFANALQFNQPISNWERSGSTTGNITVMTSMFSGANVFNQPIDNWNVSGVTSMDYMFQQASAFNQTLSNWERVGSTLANVLNMNYMFQSSAFNQNIGNWNVSKVASFIGFMSTKTPATFSSTNLDAIYNGWIVNGVKPNINISFGTAKHTAAGAIGRATLAAPPNGTGTWTITDGGQI